MRRALLCLLTTGLLSCTALAGGPPAFAPAEVPAHGIQQATLTLPAPAGVYALWTNSPQGTALRLIDRTTGPGAQVGVPGKSDGRINALLDAGEYRVQTQASESGEGAVKLQLRAYQELHPTPPRLNEFQPVSAKLGDFEQRSYVFTLKEPQQVHFQVGGRALDSVRLWQAGQWLVDSVSHQEQVEPLPGQPYTLIQLSAALAPGQYQLTVYGGAALPWTQNAEQFPLYLEFGLPKLPASYRGYHTLSPLGVASYLVPARSRFFRLELPKSGTAELRLSAYAPEQPYTQAKVQRALKPDTNPPQLELDLEKPAEGAQAEATEGEAEDGAEEEAAATEDHADTTDTATETAFDFQQAPPSGYYLLQVQGKAGQGYTLQQLPKVQNPYPVQGSGDYWLGMTYTGAASDQLSANAVLTVTDNSGKTTLVKHQTVTLDGVRAWRGKFNLDGEFSLLVQVTQNTEYAFEAGGGAEARLRLTPFFAEAQAPLPAYRPAGGKWKLAPGFYWLQGEAVEPGLLELALSPVKPPKKLKPGALNHLAAVGFSAHLEANQHYNLWLNTQPGVRAGLDLRALPLDLGQPLPLAQAPGEYTAPSIEVTEPGVLEAVAENGQNLELSLADTARWKTQLNLNPHTESQVKIRHAGDSPIAYLLRFTPQRGRTTEPGTTPAVAPELPILPLNQTLAAQLASQGSQLYQLQINTAGIYQLGSQGLLNLSGTLRTRLLPTLGQKAQGGSGRNFIVYDYLNPGDYQLAVRAEGEAYGDYSLRAQPLPLQDGGWLRPDQQALPAELAAGEALQLRVRIETSGTYQFEVLGLNQRQFRLRLEDSAGWPVVKPQTSKLIETPLAAGEYRLIILPETLPARLTARLTTVKTPLALTGHGPHPLAWDTALEHVWQEPEEGAPRNPDRWQFTLPAPLDVNLSLAAEMRAELVRLDTGGTPIPVATFVGGKNWEGALTRGAYELRVQALAQNNRLPYRIQLSAKQFSAGQTKMLTLPANLPLRVAGDELLELASWGNIDTRLRLYDAQNQLVAEQDDSPLGWNVQFVGALPAGEYRLRLEQISGNPGTDDTSAVTTQLSARAWPVTTANALKAGERRQVRLNQAYRFPLTLGDTRALMASAQAGTAFGLSIGREGAGAPWLDQQTGEQVNLPWLAKDQTRYQIWLWPVGGATDASIEWRDLLEQTATTAELRQGLPARHNGWQLYRVALGSAATVLMRDAPESLLASAGPEQIFRPLREPHFALDGKVWLLPGVQATGPVELQHLSIPVQAAALPIALPEHASTVLDAGGAPEGIRVVVAEASRGLPLVAWLDDTAPLPGISAQSSASVSLSPTQTQLRLWRGDSEAFPLQIALRQYRYPLPVTPLPLASGQQNLDLNPLQALRCRLPGGPLRLSLNLPAQALAVLSQRDKVTSTHYSGAHAHSETVDTEADTLWLLTLQDQATSANLYVEAIKQPERLISDRILRRSFTQPGIWQLELRLPEAERRAQMRLFGLGGTVSYLSTNQNLHDPAQPLVSGGTIRVQHPAGTVALWLAGEGESLDPWLNSPMQRINLEKSVQEVELEGSAQTLRVEASEPRLLHLRASSPLLAALRTPSAAVTARAFPHGLDWDISLPQGVSLISLHPLHGGTLDASVVQLTTQTPALLAEGLGAPVLLAPGSHALFRIELAQAAQIGVGVHADPDRITTLLRRADGSILGSGVIQWQQLAAGRYWLELHAPEDGAPILARPAVVGLRPPSSLPPADLLRSYLDLARTTP